ncbi:hypothetical protein [Hamadaea tsunoensis]|uniref:hypothetical protein n=1 Tax=Hamadaea tsunoensis TaxID=53368 RepID=UPI000422504E|nr:hypothetical protein [Hamadaea tsunoensis]
MSARGWAGSVAQAIGVAAATGAAQLGIGYGLGIIGWLGDPSGWAAALAWTLWVAALAVVFGAVLVRRRTGPGEVESGWARGLWRAVVACAAAVGAGAVVPLTALPARQVSTAATFAPAWIVGWYAAVGVLVGLLFAILALAARSMAANLIATGVWWWLVAVVTVLDSVAGGTGLVPTQLGVWRFAGLGRASADGELSALAMPGESWWHAIYLPGMALTLAAAFVIGLLAAVPAARRGEARVAVALSGAAGPLLLAVAMVLAAPRLGGAPVEQLSALLVAPYTVVAGVLGSIVAALVFGRVRRDEEPPTAWVPVEIEPQPVGDPFGAIEPVTPPQAQPVVPRPRKSRPAPRAPREPEVKVRTEVTDVVTSVAVDASPDEPRAEEPAAGGSGKRRPKRG